MGGEAEAFIRRWQGSGGAERANYALFLAELCDVIGVLRPEPMPGHCLPRMAGQWIVLRVHGRYKTAHGATAS